MPDHPHIDWRVYESCDVQLEDPAGESVRKRRSHGHVSAGMSWQMSAPFNGELEEPDPSVVLIKRPGSGRNLRSNLGIGVRILDPPFQSLEGTEQPQMSLDMPRGQAKAGRSGGDA